MYDVIEVLDVYWIDDAMINSVRCDEEIDSVWNVQWTETLSGRRDFQLCPATVGSETNGTALYIHISVIINFLA